MLYYNLLKNAQLLIKSKKKKENTLKSSSNTIATKQNLQSKFGLVRRYQSRTRSTNNNFQTTINPY